MEGTDILPKHNKHGRREGKLPSSQASLRNVPLTL
jgi:hypothetical protein